MKTKQMEAEIRPFLSGMLMRKNPLDLDEDDLVAAYGVLHSMEAMIKKRKEALREHVVALVQEDGSPTEQGGWTGRFEGGKVVYEKRTSALPDEAELVKFFKEKGLDTDLIYSEVRTKVLDPSKIAALVENGKIKQKVVDDAKKVSFALSVKPSTELEILIEQAAVPETSLTESATKARTRKAAASGSRKGA